MVNKSLNRLANITRQLSSFTEAPSTLSYIIPESNKTGAITLEPDVVNVFFKDYKVFFQVKDELLFTIGDNDRVIFQEDKVTIVIRDKKDNFIKGFIIRKIS